MVIDKYPNVLKIGVTESAVNTYTGEHIEWPSTLARSAVIELLEIRVLWDNPQLFAATETVRSFHVTLDTNATALENLSSNSCIIRDMRTCQAVGARTNEATGVRDDEHYAVYSFQSVDGRGLLLPATEWEVGIKSTNCTAAASMTFEFVYRVKEVPASELLDILETYA